MKTVKEARNALERIRNTFCSEFLASEISNEKIEKEIATIEDFFSGDRIEGSATAICDEVLYERKRQVVVEGYSRLHDDEEHCYGELALAAASYALIAVTAYAQEDIREPIFSAIRSVWPFVERIKPKTARSDLVRAAALIVAEVERIDRAENKKAAYAVDQTPAEVAPAITFVDVDRLSNIKVDASRVDLQTLADNFNAWVNITHEDHLILQRRIVLLEKFTEKFVFGEGK